MAIALLKKLLKNSIITGLAVSMLVIFNSGTASAQDLPITNTVPSHCSFEMPENPDYKATVLQTRHQKYVTPGSSVPTKILVKNDGNVAWFSEAAGCADQKTTWLGTHRQKDRNSSFYKAGAGWHSPSRIHMKQQRVNPGEIATFEFEMAVPGHHDFYKEYFAPLVDGVTWMEDAIVGLDIQAGALADDAKTVKEKRDFLYYSNSASKFKLDGERSLVIDLAKQKMWARIDDVVVKEMRTSTGAYDTPTPQGNLKIAFKNRVRIGGAAPHYIMEYFMGLEWDTHKFNGYGIHNYPAEGNAGMRAEIRKRLANNEDYFEDIWAEDQMWKNAHYDIGKKVSHGCIRNDHSRFVYQFMDVGDRVHIFANAPADMINPPASAPIYASEEEPTFS